MPCGCTLTKEFSLFMTVVALSAVCQIFPVLSFFCVHGTISFPGFLEIEWVHMTHYGK